MSHCIITERVQPLGGKKDATRKKGEECILRSSTALFNCLYTVKLQQNFCLIHMVGFTQKENVPPKGKGANKTSGKKKGEDTLF